MSHVTGGRCEGSSLLVHQACLGSNSLGDDSPIPSAGTKYLESLWPPFSKRQMVRDFPRGCEEEPVASWKAVRLVCVRVLVIGGMEPIVRTGKDRITLRHEPQSGKLHQRSWRHFGEHKALAVGGRRKDRPACTGCAGGDAVGQDSRTQGAGPRGHLLGFRRFIEAV